MSEFYTDEVVTSTIRHFNKDKIEAEVQKYLDENLVGGEKFKTNGLGLGTFTTDHLVINLVRPDCDKEDYWSGYHIDEDFPWCDKFRDFLDELAKRCGALSIGVPTGYYSK